MKQLGGRWFEGMAQTNFTLFWHKKQTSKDKSLKKNNEIRISGGWKHIFHVENFLSRWLMDAKGHQSSTLSGKLHLDQDQKVIDREIPIPAPRTKLFWGACDVVIVSCKMESHFTPSACQENLRIWTIRSWGFWRIFLGNSLLIFELIWWMAKSLQASNHILHTPYNFAPPNVLVHVLTANPGAIDLGNDFGHGEKGECSISHDRRYQGQLSNHIPP